jgi:hypothetical protein
MNYKTTIQRKAYTVYSPLNSWDMNYHFIDKNGIDYLVDLQDVCDWIDHNSATIENAIAYAKELASDGVQWYWHISNNQEASK